MLFREIGLLFFNILNVSSAPHNDSQIYFYSQRQFIHCQEELFVIEQMR